MIRYRTIPTSSLFKRISLRKMVYILSWKIEESEYTKYIESQDIDGISFDSIK